MSSFGNSRFATQIALMMFIMLAGCTPAPVASAPTPAVASIAQQPTSSTSTSKGPAFQQLVARAKASDGNVRGPVGAYTPDEIKLLESAFQQRFGFTVHVEDEPGHNNREVPQKSIQAFQAGKGLVDWYENLSPTSAIPIMQAGALGTPPWDALTQEWPQIQEFRAMIPDAVSSTGSHLRDSCMLQTQATWSLVYNTRTVKPDEVQNVKWDDLLSPKWKGRLAFDDGALGFIYFPFNAQWPTTRLAAYMQNLGANGLKLVPGGSSGVLNAVAQGEGDIGMTATTLAVKQMNDGAPIKLIWPELVPGYNLPACMPKLTANNPDMAALWFAWKTIEGEVVLGENGAGGARPFYAPEADKYPLGRLLQAASVKSDALVGPATVQDFTTVDDYRAIAVDALKKGVQTGQTVPYPPK